ncbi:sulfatase-like hydrolase/transferase [Thermodesulfobacteriota bacterium]
MPNNHTNSIFALTIIVSLLVFTRCRPGRFNKLVFSCIIFLNLFLFLIHKGADYFTGEGIDYATITLFKFGFKGAGAGDYTGHLAFYSGLLTLVLTGLVFFIFRKPATGSDSLKKKILAYSLVLTACIFNPASIDIYNLPTGSFIPSRASSDFANAEFYKYYEIPKLKQRRTAPKNLVLIYAESLERAFFNEDVFPDLLPRLKDLEREGITFTNMHMTHGTGGTIWAISASQCGLPLFLPNQSIMTHGGGRFLPAAICLGDVLRDEGYHLAYFGGASLSFTGKGNFFKSHGFEEVFGREELRSKLDDPNYLNHWGLYDDSLLDISFKRFIELSKTEDKFGLFLLTIDAHMPGYSSKKCSDIAYGDGDNTHLNAIACTDYQLSEFIRKISQSPYADQTVIVIASDHVNWNGAPSIELLKKARDGNKNLFMIIEPGKIHGKNVETRGTAFDIGTTILPYIGYDGVIGLGRDLLNESEEKIEEIAYIQTRLFNWKTEILKFWGQSKIKKSLSIDVQKEQITIDNKDYDLPVVIELNEDLSATLLFNLRRFHLAKYMGKLKPDQKLLMINPCKDIEVSGNQISDSGEAISRTGWCMMASTGTHIHTLEKLDQPVSYDATAVKGLLEIPIN